MEGLSGDSASPHSVTNSGDFVVNTLKRKGSSIVSQNGDAFNGLQTLKNEDSCVKRPRIDSPFVRSQTDNDVIIHRQNGHDMSPSSSENTLEYANIVDAAKGDNSNNDQEELSPTLETSYDFLSSPESPDWLKDDYFEKRLAEHSSQKSVKENLETGDQINNNIDDSADTVDYKDDSKYVDYIETEMDMSSNSDNAYDTDNITINEDKANREEMPETSAVILHESNAETPQIGKSVPENTETSPAVTNSIIDLNDEDVSVVSNINMPTGVNYRNILTKIIPSIASETPSIPSQSQTFLNQSPTIVSTLEIPVDCKEISVPFCDKNRNNVAVTANDVICIDNDSRSSDSVIYIPDEDVSPITSGVVNSVNLLTQNTISVPNTSNVLNPSTVNTTSQSLEIDANKILDIVPDTDLTILLERLKQKQDDKSRVDIVLNEVLEGQLENAVKKFEEEKTKTSDPEERILAEVTEVRKQVPTADPNSVFYMLLESTSPEGERVKTVVDRLITELKVTAPQTVQASTTQPNSMTAAVAKPLNLPRSDSSVGDPALRGDKLYSDMRTIAKIFPNKDQNEIYAYLEGYHNNPNRVQLVMDELLTGSNSQPETPPIAADVVVIDRPTTAQAPPPQQDSNQTQAGNMSIKQEVEQLSMIFPDCDPNYLYEKLEKTAGQDHRIQNIAAEMFEKRDYPKLKDALEKQAQADKRTSMINLILDMTEFLIMFPEPEKEFYNEDRAVTDNYKEHAIAQLLNYFPLLKETFVKKAFEKKKGHFTPTLRELEIEAANYSGSQRKKKSTKYMKTARMVQRPFPEQLDEFFFKELLYTKHEEEIKDYISRGKLLRTTQLEAARANGSLMECGCCFDDECIFEDMAACTDGHLFCKECIRRSAEVQIGENKFEFPCLGDGCEHKFQIQMLQSVLPHNVFSNVLRKLQEEEIKQADIPDLVSCPFCSFATIMPDPNDKVFVCLNPECLKQSCRLCKEPNHVPLRCGEVEKKGETSMRTFIENRITEAMLRTCWKCKKKFFKIDGCNKMTCTCGSTMCYVCREPAIDYNHFTNNKNCNAFTDMNELHQQEMEKAAKEAKEKYAQENPESSGLSLKNDPMKLVEEMRQERLNQQLRVGQGVMIMNPVNYIGQAFFGWGHQMAHNYGDRYDVDDNEDDSERDDDDDDDDDPDDVDPSNSEDEEEDEDGYYNYY